MFLPCTGNNLHCETREEVRISPAKIYITNRVYPKYGMVLLSDEFGNTINFGATMLELQRSTMHKSCKADYKSLFQFFGPINGSEEDSNTDSKVIIRNVATQKFVKLSSDGRALATESSAHNASVFFLEPM